MRSTTRFPFAATVLAVLLVAGSAEAAIIHVSPTCTGDGSPASPAGLQPALDTASANGEADTIRLMGGEYSLAAELNYQLSQGYDASAVTLEGGWMPDWSGRDLFANPTVLNGNDTVRILIVAASNIAFTLTVDGVQFLGGNSASAGGGIRATQQDSGYLTLNLVACNFTDCRSPAGYGGALYSNGLYSVFGCQFTRCSAFHGGAIASMKHSAYDVAEMIVSVTGSIFDECTNIGGWQGSAIINYCVLTIEQSTFMGQHDGTTSGSGSHIYSDTGTTLNVRHSTFQGITTDDWGSAIEFWQSGGEVSNCLFLGNRSGEVDGNATIDIFDGGGDGGAAGPIHITNSTFAANRSGGMYGGAVYSRHHDTVVTNCLFWDCGERPLYHTDTGNPSASYSLVQGGLASTGWTDGGSNLLAETLSPFSGPGHHDLAQDSAAVDVGDNTATGVGTLDLAGKARLFDGDDDGTDTVDMGCFEFQVTPVSPDRGTIGSVLTLASTGGFGTKKPKVWLQYVVVTKEKIKKKALKVLEYSDTEIKAYMKAKLPAGEYDLKVQPKVKGAEVIDQGEFTIVRALAGSLSADSGESKDEITATGKWFGDKKAKVKVYYEYVDPKKGKTKRKKCKVVKNGLVYDPATGANTLKFLVPKVKVTTGDIVLVNKVGEITLMEDFQIGSD